MKQIETVLGPIQSTDLGLTLTHEHLLNDVLSWWHPPLDDSPRSRELVDEKVSIANIWELKHDPFINKDNCTMQDLELAIAEVQRFVDQGWEIRAGMPDGPLFVPDPSSEVPYQPYWITRARDARSS